MSLELEVADDLNERRFALRRFENTQDNFLKRRIRLDIEILQTLERLQLDACLRSFRLAMAASPTAMIRKMRETICMPMTSAFLNAGVGIVVVDALEILRLNPVPCVLVRLEPQDNVANQILDEHRVFVRPLGDGLFVRPLEQRVQLQLADSSTSAIRSSIHTVPDERMATVTSPR